MKQVFAILLVVGALALGYLGYTKLENSRADIKIGDLEISAKDKGSNNDAYIMFGLGAVCLIAGLMVYRGGKGA